MESNLYSGLIVSYVLTNQLSRFQVGANMSKKVQILIDLLPEAFEASFDQIEETIKREARIPFCKQIEKVTIEDTEEPYNSLKKHGISNNVAKNIMDLYNQE